MKFVEAEPVDAVIEKDVRHIYMTCEKCGQYFKIICPSTGGAFQNNCPRCGTETGFHINLLEK